MGSSGCFTHADNPANASEALISFMKSRREAPSGQTDACRGNSRCNISTKPSVWANSSRHRQYCGPLLARASLSCIWTNSSLLGQTASDLFGLSFSIFNFQFRVLSFQFPVSSCRTALLETRNLQLETHLLAVTGTATGNALGAANVVTVLQLVAQGDLIGEDAAILQLHLILRAGLFVAHVKHLVAGTEKFFRRAMAVQTPFHLQRVGRVGQRHLVHRPVATRTANAFIDMNAVVEINEVRKVVDPGPDQ